MKVSKFLLVSVVLLICAIASSNAQLHTLYIKGTVICIEDRMNATNNSISLGDTLVGTIKYPLNSIDQNDFPTVSDYWTDLPGAGFDLAINNLRFRTHPDSVNFLTEVLNDFFVQHESYSCYSDGTLFRSYKNTYSESLPYYDENHIALQLDDESGTAIDNLNIPTMINLNSWVQIFALTIEGRNHFNPGIDSNIFIRVLITSVSNGTESSGFSPVTGNNQISESFLAPNPLKTTAILNLAAPVSNAELKIYNALGEVVKSMKNVSGSSIAITRDDLTTGTYFLCLNQGTQQIFTTKFIVE